MSANISSTDLKRLLLESGGICAFPSCKRRLVTSDSPLESGAVIAEIAHIIAESREGPRGNIPMDEKERNRHENLVVLCPEHHKVIDSQPNTFSIQVLRQMKADHLTAVQRKLQTDLKPKTQSLITEIIHSAVLTVSHLPQAVFEADCAFGSGEEEQVRKRISAPQDHEVLLPFILTSGKLLCFQNLQRKENPFAKVIDSRKVHPISATKLWQSDDGKRLYVRLLNRSLYKYAGHRGVRFDTDHRRFHFIPEEKGKIRQVSYKSLTGRNVKRQVVWRPLRKKTGITSKTWWHVAAGLRFHQVSPISPWLKSGSENEPQKPTR